MSYHDKTLQFRYAIINEFSLTTNNVAYDYFSVLYKHECATDTIFINAIADIDFILNSAATTISFTAIATNANAYCTRTLTG